MTDATDWRGGVGDVWASEWQRTDRALAPLNAALEQRVRVLLPSPRKILDIGCGAGTTSLTLAGALPDASVLGIDLSPALTEVASERAGAMSNIAFAVADAARFENADFRPDLLVSRHGVMFFDDPVAAFVALRRAAAPGARLLFSCFRSVADNDWASMIASLLPDHGTSRSADMLLGPGPFAFADCGRVGDILTRAGWQNGAAEPFDFVYRAGAGQDPVADAMAFLRRIGPAARALRELEPDAAEALADGLEAQLRRRVSGGTVDLGAAAWIWSATAGENQP
jgi:SAM-dependent methyltransferase